VRKAELRYALDKAKRTRNLASDALCTFHEISNDATKPNGLLKNPDIIIPAMPKAKSKSPRLELGQEIARDIVRRISGLQADRVDFGQYVDEVSCFCVRLHLQTLT
jgi:chloride channel 3/4/5